jgi:biotin carboxyl carrier protein
VKFKIQVDGKEYEIEAAAAGTVSVGGESFDTKVGRPSAERRTVQVGDNSYEVRIVESCPETGIFVLEIAGERIPLTVSEVVKTAPQPVPGATAGQPGGADDSAGAAGRAPMDVKEGVWAPVPGKIVNVLVKPGDKVNEGTPVVILEAMKMENELHAPTKGTVTAVLVKKGDQAEKGQLLVALE